MNRLWPSGAARVAGVVGRPIGHSLSPLLHRTWLKTAGIDGLYAPFSPPTDGFAVFIQGVRRSGITGLNITLPFKLEALALADRVDDAARAAGAANLLLFDADGAVEARNTDGVGLLAALYETASDLDLAARPAVVLGAGGAAQGAVAALLQAGAPTVHVLNRSPDRARAMAEATRSRVIRAGRILPGGLTPPEIVAATAEAGVIVNATAAAQAGEPLVLDFAGAPKDAVAMDMTYRPLITPFLAAATRAGLRTADGLSMLINQAIPSFEALFGAPPPRLDARALLIDALEAGG